MNVTNDIFCVGVNDMKIDIFEGQYLVPKGMAYNSYVIVDDKIAVMDTVDRAFGEAWINNIVNVLNGRDPDYLVVHHMEPDHSSNIMTFAKKWPNAVIVASAKAFTMMKAFYCEEFLDRRIVVAEGSTLELGRHTLTFIAAPMVHWPEVVLSYDNIDKVLFSADAFGKFGALDADEPWTDEARRYYIGIVGKYGVQVQALLKKAAKLDIQMICSLHGPILRDNLSHYINLYNIWSSYQPEDEGVVIAYASVYGNTKTAALKLSEALSASHIPNVIYDLARSDIHAAVADAFRYNKLVLASLTYNCDVFPCMKSYIEMLVERNYQNRTVAFIENGSWAPMAAKVMKSMFEKSKNLTMLETQVTLRSAIDAQSEAQIAALAAQLA